MNDPAFPATAYDENGHMAQGMTLRDYFAAKAMQGFLFTDKFDYPYRFTAKDAYEMADAMIKERTK